jgi:hypothetical protein
MDAPADKNEVASPTNLGFFKQDRGIFVAAPKIVFPKWYLPNLGNTNQFSGVISDNFVGEPFSP